MSTSAPKAGTASTVASEAAADNSNRRLWLSVMDLLPLRLWNAPYVIWEMPLCHDCGNQRCRYATTPWAERSCTLSSYRRRAPTIIACPRADASACGIFEVGALHKNERRDDRA